MKLLTKKQLAEKAKAIEETNDAYTLLEKAVDEFNEAMTAQEAKVTAALEAYNDKLSAIRELWEEVIGDAQSSFDDKSEKWQESDKGQSLQSAIHEWESNTFDDLEIEFPEQIETPENLAELFDGLPEDAE